MDKKLTIIDNRVLALLKRFKEKYNRLCSVAYITNQLKITDSEARQSLVRLQNVGDLYKNADGQYQLKNKEARKTFFQVGKEKLKNLKVPEKKLKVYKPETKKTTINKIVDYLIITIMFAVSSAAIVLSIYYSRFWLLNFLNVFLASILATTMILYATFAPQASMHFWNQKRFVAFFLISFTGLIVLLFSIVSTVAGQYNVRMSKVIIEDTQNIQSSKSLAELDLLKADEATIITGIERVTKEVDINRALLAQFTKEDMYKEEFKNGRKVSNQYQMQLWKLGNLQAKITEYEDELKAKRQEIKDYLQKSDTLIEEKKEVNFYTWLAGFFNWPAKYIEFFLYMFPAVFIDIISPLGMFAALSYRRKL